MNSCPACAAPLKAGEKACVRCGLLLGSTPAGPPKLPSAPTCPYCGTQQRPKARACSACGESLLPRPLRAGESLDNGRFLVQAPLTTGGMGALYLASDQRAFGRRVVLKALGDEQNHTTASEQLRTEGWLLAQLRQPNMPHMLGFFEHGTQCFVAIEFIEGPNLHNQLSDYQQDGTLARAGKPFDHDNVLRWGATIARTLEYLHGQKPYAVIHQDIKPANLMLEQSSGTLKLIDFGNATLFQPEQAAHEAFGTPGYAPREQYRGQSEPRSDVYALAATLYHLTTDDDPAVHPFRFPQLGRLGAFGEVLGRALANDPAERPSATVFRAQLEALTAAQASPRLHAPDGNTIEDESELVAWCEANWQAATAWLAADLPEHIQRWRGAKRAAQLRELLQNHPSLDSALDAWLANIDPLGFGALTPALVVSSRLLSIPRAGVALTLANTGRRLVTARLAGPTWLRIANPSVSIAPGHHIRIQLSKAPTKAKRRAALEITAGSTVLAVCQVRPGA